MRYLSKSSAIRIVILNRMCDYISGILQDLNNKYINKEAFYFEMFLRLVFNIGFQNNFRRYHFKSLKSNNTKCKSFY